jgi:hypothetical protein
VAALLCAYAGRSFLRHVAREVPLRPECHNAVGKFSAADGQDSVAYHACLEERAKLFFDRDYAETRDISKAFLTLLTAVFVASITFSEKIVDLHKSGWWPRALMICCWVSLLIAIAACGAALALMMQAAGYASYYPQADFWVFEADAVRLYLCSGFSFGVGLVCLLVAGIISLVDGQVRAAEGATG